MRKLHRMLGIVLIACLLFTGTAKADGKQLSDFSFSELQQIYAQRHTVVAGGNDVHWLLAAVRQDGTVFIHTDEYNDAEFVPWTNIIALAMDNHRLAGLKADGTVVQKMIDAGYDGATTVYDPITGLWLPEAEDCDVSGWTDIISIDCNYRNVVGLKSDGTVVAAGDNSNGQCETSHLRDVTAVAVGDGYVAACKKDGTVELVGVSGGEEVTVEQIRLDLSGYGYDEGTATIRNADLSAWTDIVALRTGGDILYGLTKDGTIRRAFVKANPEDYPWKLIWHTSTPVDDWTDVIAITGDLVGLRKDGTVLNFGFNANLFGPEFDVQALDVTDGGWYRFILNSDHELHSNTPASFWDEHYGPFSGFRSPLDGTTFDGKLTCEPEWRIEVVQLTPENYRRYFEVRSGSRQDTTAGYTEENDVFLLMRNPYPDRIAPDWPSTVEFTLTGTVATGAFSIRPDPLYFRAGDDMTEETRSFTVTLNFPEAASMETISIASTSIHSDTPDGPAFGSIYREVNVESVSGCLYLLTHD